MSELLTSHDVTWGRKDSYCPDQYLAIQPEEEPSMPVTTAIRQLEPPTIEDAFRRFNFEEGLADD